MVSLDKKRSTITPPPILASKECVALIEDIIANPMTHNVNSHFNHSSVRAALQEKYHQKCAYCETDVSAGASFRVDHYRPKRYIKGVDRLKHYGYFWLAYEWTNFLQSCEACNLAKSNSFPLLDPQTRVEHIPQPPDYTTVSHRPFRSSPLMNERRMLLHPEFDAVEDYLKFHFDGSVSPAVFDSGDREKIAKETIKICKLNRGNLIRARKKKIDQYHRELVDILNDYEDRGADMSACRFLYSDLRKYFRNMLREQDEKEAYSRVGFFMFHNFKEFYIDRLSAYGDIQLVENYYNQLVKI